MGVCGYDSGSVKKRQHLLVLDLRLDHVDRVRGLHLEGDGLASQSLDEDLQPPTTTSKHKRVDEKAAHSDSETEMRW